MSPCEAGKRLRVVLAEDQAMVLGAFASLLDLQPDVEVVATAREGRRHSPPSQRTTPTCC